MKSALRTLLRRGPFARRMSSAAAARPTSGLALATVWPQAGAVAAGQFTDGGSHGGHRPSGSQPTGSPVHQPLFTGGSPAVASSVADHLVMACPVMASTAVANPVTDSPAKDSPATDSPGWPDSPAAGPAQIAWLQPAGGQPVGSQPGGRSGTGRHPLHPAAHRFTGGTRPFTAEAPASPEAPVASARLPGSRPARVVAVARPARSGLPTAAGRGRSARAVDMDLAAEFIQLHRREVPGAGPAGPRLREIRREIRRTGTYRHTLEELEFGARVAWRNSSRCIGRLYWQSLKVRDRREVTSAADIAAECADAPAGRHEPRPGAGPSSPCSRRTRRPGAARASGTSSSSGTPATAQPDGPVRGEPRSTELTDLARALGWATAAGAGSTSCRWSSRPPTSAPGCLTCPPTRSPRCRPDPPATSPGSPSWACAGTRCR